MCESLFGNRFSNFDIFVIAILASMAGAGALTFIQVVGLGAAGALVSVLLTNMFARKS
jgi:uncharacterized paraquat-inducible protein A